MRYYLEECKLDPRVWNDAPAPESPLYRAQQNKNEEMIELITKYWIKFDEADEKKAEKKAKKKELLDSKHRAEVSRMAEEKRVAAGAGKESSVCIICCLYGRQRDLSVSVRSRQKLIPK